MNTTDCTGEVERVMCGQDGRYCGREDCPRCGCEETMATRMEYELKVRQRGYPAALEDAVDALGKLRSQIARQMREREVDLQQRAVASGGALTPGDVDATDDDNDADREASRADAASDWAREEPAVRELEGATWPGPPVPESDSGQTPWRPR